MSARSSSIVAALAVGALLAGCGEKPQTLGTPKSDAAPFTGTVAPGYTASGWKQGDKASWEQHMRARTQNGQNEYAKTAR